MSRFGDDEATVKHAAARAASPPKVLELVAAAARDTPEQLSDRLASMMLVGPKPAEQDDEWSFRTASFRTVRENVGGMEVIVDEGFVVHPLKKVRGGPFASTILLGRSGSNDVCILHSSVSKLHARLTLKPEGLMLSDAGSSNGTSVNGKRLGDKEEVPLRSGDFLLFGACHFVALDASALHAILLRFSQMK